MIFLSDRAWNFPCLSKIPQYIIQILWDMGLEMEKFKLCKNECYNERGTAACIMFSFHRIIDVKIFNDNRCQIYAFVISGIYKHSVCHSAPGKC